MKIQGTKIQWLVPATELGHGELEFKRCDISGDWSYCVPCELFSQGDRLLGVFWVNVHTVEEYTNGDNNY